MALKRFNADLRTARLQLDDPGIPGVLDIEHGDSEGEAKIMFVHERLERPLPIQLLAQDVSKYPDNSNFLLFTDDDDVPPVVISALKELQRPTLGLSIPQCIHDVAAGLSCKLSSVDAAGDSATVTEDSSGSYDDDEDYLWDTLYGDDELFGLPFTARSTSKNDEGAFTHPDDLQRLKQDLRAVREAGCRVGVLNVLDNHSLTRTISISMRVSKMDLSSETLEAWDIECSDYIILLIEIEGGYRPADSLRFNANPVHMRFRFGKSSKYKPSYQAARDAFLPIVPSTSNTDPPSTTQNSIVGEPEARPFTKLFISNSLERFMNEDFIKMMKLRLRNWKSWDDANSHLRNLTKMRNGTSIVELDSTSSRVEADEGKAKENNPPNRSFQANGGESVNLYPENFFPDPFTLPVDNISLPLVAMDFATHYFTRCIEYCLRCHRRLPRDFEALRPFVCSDPLCLFQYMTMGFGPSIEHEILTQPYVVDLLVNLCYSSVVSPQNNGSTYPIREFPVGLRLKVPHVSIGMANRSVDVAGPPILVEGKIDAHFLATMNTSDLDRISPNTFAELREASLDTTHQPLLHRVLVKSVDRKLNQINFEFRHRDSPSSQTSSSRFNKTMTLAPCDIDIDDLKQDEKARAIVVLLDSLPPIARLRDYLLEHPNGKLTSYPDIPPSTRTLLQWIVASNRSCIQQVSPAQEIGSVKRDNLFICDNRTRPQEQILGLPSGYVQFRFAQGSPDKERRFHRALNETVILKGTKHPTIFAWHGSRLSNWHSILRQGLDYTEIHNGRAFGNGVYFSRSYDTSAGYSGQELCWPRSALQPDTVVSLCEIINSPESFVSINPYYVVSNVDWIQCRYLFVHQMESSGSSMDLKTDDNQTIDEIAQDPKYRVVGPRGKNLKIPIKALPSSRTAQQRKEEPNSSLKRRSSTLVSDTDTEEEETADVEALLSDDESSLSSSKRARTMDSTTAFEPRTKRPPRPPMTDFRPDSLDLSSLPRLSLPQWANPNSSKRLAAEIKRLQKIQTTTPLHELGWYVHLDNIENMFQWILELHSFDPELPLAKDMKQAGIISIVLEVRFGRDFPFSPPFVRVIRPRFLPFMNGGGGHVTIGGAICMELLTSTGWTPAHSMEGVFMSIKMAMSSLDPKPARLEIAYGNAKRSDYAPWEALEAYQRAAARHGWQVPQDVQENAGQTSVAADADR